MPVTFNVRNIGKVPGAEVAQVYVTDDKCSVVRPVKELKGFEKVYLKPGETKTLDQEAFRFYDSFGHDFVVEPVPYTRTSFLSQWRLYMMPKRTKGDPSESPLVSVSI